jgi:hypothetical protein
VIDPPVPDQFTEVFVEPVTVAVNCCVPPVLTDADVGLIDTATDCVGAVTVTVAEDVFVESAALLAVIV